MNRLFVLGVITALLVAAAAGAATGPQAGRAKITKTWSLRWPATGKQRANVHSFAVSPAITVRKVRVFVNGAEVGPEPADYIVACAHRGPSFASKAWLEEGSLVYVFVVLETGTCSPPPTVAGKLTTVKAIVTY